MQQPHLKRPFVVGTQSNELPAGVPAGQSGTRLVAFTALLMGMFRQTKRRMALFCETLLGHSLSPGLVVKLQQQASDALACCHKELVDAIPKQPAVCADETPTRQANMKAWIWTVVAANFTLFRIRLTKAAGVIKELLGEEFSGVVTSDRAKTYHWICRQQWCWAHLKRTSKKWRLVQATQAALDGNFWSVLTDCSITGIASAMERLLVEVFKR